MNKILKIQFSVSESTHKKFVEYCKKHKVYRERAYSELLEKALNKKTVEDKFLETFDFLNEENVSEIVDVVFESNELREIVKSKFEAINKK